MKSRFVLVVLAAAMVVASCSSSDDGATTDTSSAVVVVDVDADVLDEVVTICTEERARDDELDLDLNSPALGDLADEALAIMDSRIERLEAVEAGTAVGLMNEIIGIYEDHRETAAELFERAEAGDIDAAVDAYGEALFLIQDVNQSWHEMGADACVDSLS